MKLYSFNEFNSSVNIDDYLSLNESSSSNTWKEALDKAKSNIKFLGKFVFNFGPGVSAFFPIFNKLVENGNYGDVTKETIVYLTIVSLALSVDIPKEDMKEAIKELKDRGVYGAVKYATTTINGIKKIFSFISKTTGRVVSSITDVLGYTSLLVPFALTFAEFISSNNLNFESLIDAGSTNSFNKMLSIGTGIGTFLVKEVVIKIIKDLKSFKDRGNMEVKGTLNKIKI